MIAWLGGGRLSEGRRAVLLSIPSGPGGRSHGGDSALSGMAQEGLGGRGEKQWLSLARPISCHYLRHPLREPGACVFPCLLSKSDKA